MIGILALLVELSPTARAEGAPAASKRLEVQITAPVSAELEGVIHARPSAAAPGDRLPEIEVPTKMPGGIVVELPAGTSWLVSVEAPGFWAAPRLVDPAASSTAEFQLTPTGRLHIPLRLPRPQQRIPADASVRFSPIGPEGSPGDPGGDVASRGTLPCTVNDRAVECPVPAGKHDLRLEVPGHAPIYLWSVEVIGGQTSVLGSQALVQGASLIGWVDVPGTACREERPKASLVPRADGVARVQAEESRLRIRTLEAEADGNGFFQIAGIETGAYTLTVSCPELAPQRRGPLWIAAQEEVRLSSVITLAPPSMLRVAIDPAVGPEQATWQLVLLRESELGERFLDRVAAGRSQEDGSWQVGSLAPGGYTLQVRGEGRTLWAQHEIEIEAGLDADLELRIPLIEVRGDVSLGGEPLASALIFSDPRKAARKSIETDEEGTFHGYLPHEGTWRISVLPKDSEKGTSYRLSAGTRDVRRPRGASPVDLPVELPDTRIEGEVVDVHGQAVESAKVSLWRGETSGVELLAEVRSDVDGRFIIRGADPGSLQIEAEAEDGASSGAMSLSVGEAIPAPEIRLVVSSRIELEGRVLTTGRPVPGAHIRARVTHPNGAGIVSFWASTAVTDHNGAFRLRVPAGDLDLLVASPSSALKLLAIPADRLASLQEEPLQIEAEPAGGAIIIDAREIVGQATDSEEAGAPIVFHGGGSARLEELLSQGNPAALGATALSFPRMESGLYTLCQSWPQGSLECQQEYLAPGSSATFHLRPPPRRATDSQGSGSPSSPPQTKEQTDEGPTK